MPQASSINDLSTITVCAWVHPNVAVTNYPMIVRKTNNAINLGWDFYLKSGTAAGYGLGTSFAGGGGFDYLERSTTGTVPLRAWSHVCMTQNGDGSANMALYVNGSVVTPNSSGNTGTRASDAGQALRIGTGVPSYINSSMDDIRVYNRALSATEITRLYNLGR